MSYMPGEVSNPAYGYDLGSVWADIKSNPYYVSYRPDMAEAIHYMMVADSMALAFDPEAAAEVEAGYVKAGRAEELDFINLIVEVDKIAIAGQVREELTTTEFEPDEASIEAAVLNGMKVGYFLTKGGFVK